MTRSETASPTTPKRGRWSKAELARLKEVYGLRDVAAIAHELKRPVASVVRAAKSLFPQEVRRTGPWTASEVLELKRYLGATSTEVIALILGRNVAEVQAQVIELGRIHEGGSWTRTEVAGFKRIFGSRTDEDLSLIFGHSVEEVGRLAREHGLSKDKAFVRKLRGARSTRMPHWKAEDVAFLRESYAAQSNLWIARKLGRSVKSVISKAHSLGLKKSSERLRTMGRENIAIRHSRA